MNLKNSLIKTKIIKKADIVLFLLIVGLAVGLILGGGKDTGDTVAIYWQGSLYGRYALDRDQRIEIRDPNGELLNLIVIEGGLVRMEEADCPGGDCLRQGSKRIVGQTIVCLPHQLLITIEGKGDYDVITY